MKHALIDLDVIEERIKKQKLKVFTNGAFGEIFNHVFAHEIDVLENIQVELCSRPALVELLTKAWEGGIKFMGDISNYETPTVSLQQFLTQNNLTDETRTD